MAQQFFRTADGTEFTSRKEANEYEAKPRFFKALEALGSIDENTAETLYQRRDFLVNVLVPKKGSKVTTKTRDKLKNELMVVLSLSGLEIPEKNIKVDIPFIVDNYEQIVNSFRFSAPRLNMKDFLDQAKEQVFDEFGDQELTEFIMQNADTILDAISALKPVVDRSASMAGLSAHRAKLNEEKAQELEQLAQDDPTEENIAAAKEAREKADESAAKAKAAVEALA